MKSIIKASALIALSGLLAVSCDSYTDNDTPDTIIEQDKDLSGVWQLVTVKRNNIDITSSMDFSKFRLHLDADARYRLENRLPFPVEENGTWSVDDPAHPFSLSFTEENTDGSIDVNILFPIVQGIRQLSITHSPGCPDNKYEYVFIKDN